MCVCVCERERERERETERERGKERERQWCWGGWVLMVKNLFLAQISVRKLFTPAKALNRLGQKTKMGH